MLGIGDGEASYIVPLVLGIGDGGTCYRIPFGVLRIGNGEASNKVSFSVLGMEKTL